MSVSTCWQCENRKSYSLYGVSRCKVCQSTKCINCGSNTKKIYRDLENKRRGTYIDVCSNPDCFHFIELNKINNWVQ